MLGFLQYLSEAEKLSYGGTYIVHPKTGQLYTGRENSLHVDMAHKVGLPRHGKGYDSIHKGTWSTNHNKKEVNLTVHVGHAHDSVIGAINKRHPGYKVNVHHKDTAAEPALRKIDRSGD